MTQASDPLITGVHHINLLVRDLEDAMARWKAQLGVSAFQIDELPGRAVRTARFLAGSTWIVLVQPVADGEPMRVLETQGEGLFLLSLGVTSLDEAMAQVKGGGGALTSEAPRTGLDGWQVIDLDPAALCGGPVQITDSAV